LIFFISTTPFHLDCFFEVPLVTDYDRKVVDHNSKMVVEQTTAIMNSSTGNEDDSDQYEFPPDELNNAEYDDNGIGDLLDNDHDSSPDLSFSSGNFAPILISIFKKEDGIADSVIVHFWN
jgi:hypothetical protein